MGNIGHFGKAVREGLPEEVICQQGPVRVGDSLEARGDEGQ